MTRSLTESVPKGRGSVSVVAVSNQGTLHEVLRGSISVDPQPVREVVDRVLNKCAVDREEIVAAMWDLVEDEGLIYDAAARIRRRG